MHYDVLIVGAGSAGCVLGSRLVPVIPAGSTNIPVIMIAEKCAENILNGYE